MNIRVLLFALARDLLGQSHVDLKLPLGSRASDVRLRLGEEHPRLLPLLTHCRLAIESEYLPDAAVLTQDCEAALIPPVSGG